MVRETKRLEGVIETKDGDSQQYSQKRLLITLAQVDNSSAGALPRQDEPTSTGRDHSLQLLREKARWTGA